MILAGVFFTLTFAHSSYVDSIRNDKRIYLNCNFDHIREEVEDDFKRFGKRFVQPISTHQYYLYEHAEVIAERSRIFIREMEEFFEDELERRFLEDFKDEVFYELDYLLKDSIELHAQPIYNKAIEYFSDNVRKIQERFASDFDPEYEAIYMSDGFLWSNEYLANYVTRRNLRNTLRNLEELLEEFEYYILEEFVKKVLREPEIKSSLKENVATPYCRLNVVDNTGVGLLQIPRKSSTGVDLLQALRK